MSTDLLAIPEEVLLDIIHSVPPLDPAETLKDIRFANDQVLDLSFVNRQLRRLCLPLLYRHILVTLTEGGLPPGATHAAQLNVLRQNLERKPHLASLIRHIEIKPQEYVIRYCIFDSLPLLPNITRIDFPSNVKLDLDFLSVISSHPSTFTAHWDNTLSFSFPTGFCFPPGALSSILVEYGVFSSGNYTNTTLQPLFSTAGLRVRSLIFRALTPPRFFHLTYPELSKIEVNAHPHHNSDGSEPFGWFPSFLERHPQLAEVFVSFKHFGPPQTWAIIKNYPILRPLYDAVQRQCLSASFSFEFITARREGSASTIANKPFEISGVIVAVHLPSATLDVMRCLASSIPTLPSLALYLHQSSSPSFTVDVDTFVSASHECLTSVASFSVTNLHRFVKLDSLSYEGEHDLSADITTAETMANNKSRQMFRLSELLAAGMPNLQSIDFREEHVQWLYVVTRTEHGVANVGMEAHYR